MPNQRRILKITLSFSSIAQPPPSPPWVELPPEITANILQRVGTVERLESAQRVCRTWWKACHDDPAVWHVVDLKDDWTCFEMCNILIKICKIAVDRSRGQLLKLSIEKFGSVELLKYIGERSSQLRYLRLVDFFDSKHGGSWKSRRLAGGLAAAAKNFPLLEELQLHFTLITIDDDIESVGCSCPLLKSFILNANGSDRWFSPSSPNDDQALAIARSMPELWHLALLHNDLTNAGLQAILDGCSHLESLDLRCCRWINLEGDLGRRCRQQIVDLKHPCDSTDDYEFNSEIWHYRSSTHGYDFDSEMWHYQYLDEYDDDPSLVV